MEIAQVPIEYLRLSPFRQGKPLPRVNAATLRAIQRHGLITPVTARPISTHQPEQYEILSGEERWLGAQQAGLHEIPVYIRRDLSTAEAEQIVRLALESEGYRLLEEATAAKELVAQGLSITEVGDRTGRTRTAVAHLLRLLKLCAPVQQLLTEGQLKYGHARPLVGLSGDQQIRLARRIIQQGLSARAAERLAQAWRNGEEEETAVSTDARRGATKDPDLIRLERVLSEQLGCPVAIDYPGQGQGQLTIQFYDLEVLEGVLARLGYED